MYQCLLFAVNNQTKCNFKMANHFYNITKFIVYSTDHKLKPTLVLVL